MKNTGIKITKRTIEEMLNDTDNASYNPATWKERVLAYAKYKNVQFYIRPKDQVFSYDRFYVSYEIPEGLYLFGQWSAFHSCIHNGGFKRIIIIEDEIVVNAFGKDKTESVINNKEGRKWLKENLCAFGIMVSNDF